MAYLKFLNSEKVYKCKVKPNRNIVTLEFDSDKEISTFGFDLYNDIECQVDIGNNFYHDFTTIYRNDKVTSKYNGYQLSNDGSVYVEPEPIPEYEPTLDEIKEQKVQEISNECKQIIYNGIDVELSVGTKHFSLKTEDQINLFGKQAQLLSGAEKFEYHADGETCVYYSKEDMQKIIETSMQFVSYHTTYCNSVYKWIDSLNSKEEVEKIKYGDVIPEQYQSEVLRDYIVLMEK